MTMYIYIYIYVYIYIYIYIYIYMYMCISLSLELISPRTLTTRAPTDSPKGIQRLARCRGSCDAVVHPIPITRFRFFRTQPLENLSAAVKLPIKKGFRATQPLEKSCEGTSCDGNWVYSLYGDLTIISPTIISEKPMSFRNNP